MNTPTYLISNFVYHSENSLALIFSPREIACLTLLILMLIFSKGC